MSSLGTTPKLSNFLIIWNDAITTITYIVKYTKNEYNMSTIHTTGINVFGKTPVRLPLKIQTTRGDRRVDAMCDTGNTIRTGAAINADYCKKIGLTWRKYKQKEPIGTAKRSSKLNVLGETTPFKVKILGLSGLMTVTAQVIEDLSQELNLGARWLQQNNLSLHFI